MRVIRQTRKNKQSFRENWVLKFVEAPDTPFVKFSHVDIPYIKDIRTLPWITQAIMMIYLEFYFMPLLGTF